VSVHPFLWTYTRDHGCHNLLDGLGPGRRAFSVGKEKVSGTDERRSERRSIGVGSDTAHLSLERQVRSEHGGSLGQDGHAGSAGFSQPGPHAVTRDNQADDGHGHRLEQLYQRGRQVVHDRAGAGRAPQDQGLRVHSAHTVEYKLGQEGVEISEVPMEDAFGATCFGGDRSARQPSHPVPAQDAFCRTEQLSPRVGHGHTSRHETSPLLLI
jgi:hypothetical protein